MITQRASGSGALLGTAADFPARVLAAPLREPFGAAARVASGDHLVHVLGLERFPPLHDLPLGLPPQLLEPGAGVLRPITTSTRTSSTSSPIIATTNGSTPASLLRYRGAPTWILS